MTLHIQRCGTGRPLVVLPSFSLDHATMAATVEPVFADLHGWQRLYVDLPGTGGSPPGEAQSDAVLDAVVGTIGAELGDERLAVIGWSFGGYLAAGLTRRLPMQVSGLMMVCTSFKIRPEDRDLTGALTSNPQPGWLSRVPPTLHGHFTHAVGLQSAEVSERISAALNLNGPTDEAYLTALRINGFALSDEATPTECDAPVCFLNGQRDRVAGFASLSGALGSFERATYTSISSAGHYLPLEQPALFAAVTRSWLTQCQALFETDSN